MTLGSHALLLVAAVPLVTVGCAAGMATSVREIDRKAERASLLEKDRRQSELNATSEDPLSAVFASFAEDVRVLPPGTPMAEGWEESRAVFAELRSLPGYSLDVAPAMAEVGGAADLGYTIGAYHMTLPDDDGNLTAVDGKYLTVWRRRPDGDWEVVVDMFNTNGPPVPVTE